LCSDLVSWVNLLSHEPILCPWRQELLTPAHNRILCTAGGHVKQRQSSYWGKWYGIFKTSLDGITIQPKNPTYRYTAKTTESRNSKLAILQPCSQERYNCFQVLTGGMR
jgi:hypothetical protein